MNLDHIEALMKAATPGEWFDQPEGDGDYCVWSRKPETVMLATVHEYDMNETMPVKANAAFIVALHNAAPELIRLARLGWMVEAASGDAKAARASAMNAYSEEYRRLDDTEATASEVDDGAELAAENAIAAAMVKREQVKGTER